MNGAAERGADQNPKCSRQKTKLRREHRPNQRSRAGDRSEMMAEDHPAICRHKIFAVVFYNRGRRTLVV